LLEAWNRGNYPAALHLLRELYIGIYAHSFGDGVFAWVVHVITLRYWSIIMEQWDCMMLSMLMIYTVSSGCWYCHLWNQQWVLTAISARLPKVFTVQTT
jgi:hypothetical protein